MVPVEGGAIEPASPWSVYQNGGAEYIPNPTQPLAWTRRRDHL